VHKEYALDRGNLSAETYPMNHPCNLHCGEVRAKPATLTHNFGWRMTTSTTFLSIAAAPPLRAGLPTNMHSTAPATEFPITLNAVENPGHPQRFNIDAVRFQWRV
jgi:hypothetical protein